jgi:sugar O-acyltransferase (sialic acid O-acetyltransferase NeuD family)
MNDLIIYGASGHAKVILGALVDTDYRLLGFIDRNDTINEFNNIPVYRSPSDLFKNQTINKKETYFIIAIGGDKGPERMEIHHQLIGYGLKPMTVIHPRSWVDPSVEIGEGTQILGMSAISAGVKIGIQTIINTNATVDHETVLGNGCHIMPAATIAGCSIISDFCTIGSNATILPRIKLSPYTVVGAGAVVIADTDPHSTVVGVPAKKVVRINK